jgi:DNA-binding NtrC family response regulator
LRTLEDKKVRRVGDVEDRTVDVRLVAATHKDLEEMVKAGSFREDLYYRLAAVVLSIPPLRERGEDVILLAEHFLEALKFKTSRPISAFSAEALNALRIYKWPGNVRELKNVIERACLMGENEEIGPEEMGLAHDGSVAFLSLKEVEREQVIAALRLSGGSKKEAAELLGIRRSTIYDKIKQHSIVLGSDGKNITDDKAK